MSGRGKRHRNRGADRLLDLNKRTDSLQHRRRPPRATSGPRRNLSRPAGPDEDRSSWAQDGDGAL